MRWLIGPPRRRLRLVSRFTFHVSRFTLPLDWSYEALLGLLIGAETCVLYLGTEALFSTGMSVDVTVSPAILFALLFLGTTVQRAIDAYHLFSPEYEVVTVTALTATLLAAVWAVAFPHY